MMPLGDAPWDKSPLLGYQLKISPIGVTMGCRPRIWSPPPLQTATDNCDRPKRWGSYEDKNVKVTVAIFQAHFSDPSCGGGVRRRRDAGGVALHLFFLQSLGPRTPLLDQRGETGCYSSADCNLHQNTSVLSIIPSTCMMFAAITSSTPCS